MPPERSLPAGGIFAPSDVTQPQFEAKTKAYCHSDPAVAGEESQIHFEPHPAMKIRPEVFLSRLRDQHDSCNVLLHD